MEPATSPLLTDLYELHGPAYLERGRPRRLSSNSSSEAAPSPGLFDRRRLERALDYLEGLSFSTEDIAWLSERTVQPA